jgi:hypothetical protein
VVLLRDAGVDSVADVRSFPKSRSNPAHNVGAPDRLAERQIGYRHMPALGGRRRRQPGVPEGVNAGWRLGAHEATWRARPISRSSAMTQFERENGRLELAVITESRRALKPVWILQREVARVENRGRTAGPWPFPGADDADIRARLASEGAP